MGRLSEYQHQVVNLVADDATDGHDGLVFVDVEPVIQLLLAVPHTGMTLLMPGEDCDEAWANLAKACGVDVSQLEGHLTRCGWHWDDCQPFDAEVGQ